MEKLSLPAVACIVVLFCVAASIASPAQPFTTLVRFAYADGALPYLMTLVESGGTFYGTTLSGGGNCQAIGLSGCGTIFSLTPAGGLTPLYSFCPEGGLCPTGSFPAAGVIIDSGYLYGTTLGGTGAKSLAINAGTTFSFVLSSSTYIPGYSFCQSIVQGICMDGAKPLAPLIETSPGSGAFLGTTSLGGGGGDPETEGGTVFPYGGPGTTYRFCSDPSCTDGQYPWAGLALAPDGNYWGTTAAGGDLGFGQVFTAQPDGISVNKIHSFAGKTGMDGSFPIAGLVLSKDKTTMYGTTLHGGAGGTDMGTVYMISTTPPYPLMLLHNFTGPEGAFPVGGLVLSGDGKTLFGTTVAGGMFGCGTLFSIPTAGGMPVVLHAFAGGLAPGPPDGCFPTGGLVLGGDGHLYGTTYEGAFVAGCPFPMGCGTIFEF